MLNQAQPKYIMYEIRAVLNCFVLLLNKLTMEHSFLLS